MPLSKLNDVIKNDVAKKTVYDKLVEKVNNINTVEFDLKTTNDTDKSYLENKISDAEGKIPIVSGLVTSAALAAAENKIPNY